MKGTLLRSVATAALLLQCLASSAQANIQPRIVGGSDVHISLFPSTVAILINSRLALEDPLFQAQSCGGTLVSPTWVVTAAHCMFDKSGRSYLPSELSILAGTTDLKAPETTRTDVSQIIIHPSYKQVVLGDDIALLQLSEPAPAPAVDMIDSRPPASSKTFIVGWGTRINLRQDGTGNFPSVLQGAIVPTHATDSCRALPGNYQFINVYTQICAGWVQGGIDSCQGDSGGPLFSSAKDGRLRLAGITSWGDGCAYANQPGIYTDVAAYKEWISNHIGISAPTRIQGLDDPKAQTSTGIRLSDTEGGASVLVIPLFLVWFRAKASRKARN